MAEENKTVTTEPINMCDTRSEYQLLPKFTAELEEIRKNGLSLDLLHNILRKHSSNSLFNRQLHLRYMGLKEGVPILTRHPLYEEERKINNKIHNDFTGLIVKSKVGCFAGNPISYSYSETDESEEVTGGKNEVEKAQKALTDFLMRNTIAAHDAEMTKNAAIYGYSGRLIYRKDGFERIKITHGYETIILSDTDITEPEYAIYYYKNCDIDGVEYWTVEFYDDRNVSIYNGSSLYSLSLTETKEHTFFSCPLQGIPNNEECMGDAEPVLTLVDAYNKILSDNANELENFTHAMLLVTILGDEKLVAEQLKKANASGTMHITPTGTAQINEPVKWLTKQVNDTFVQHTLETIRENVHTFSQTPNFADEKFGSASGIALEHKFNGMREKCTTFKSNVLKAAMYMWKVLAESFEVRGIHFDPLQVVMNIKFNIPQDVKSEMEVVKMALEADLPKTYAFGKLSDVDDPDYLIEQKKAEQEDETDVTSFYENTNKVTDDANDEATNTELNKADSAEAKINLLNGAQIQALTGIVQSYNRGDLSRNAAITLAVSSLGISRDNAEAIIEERIS